MSRRRLSIAAVLVLLGLAVALVSTRSLDQPERTPEAEAFAGSPALDDVPDPRRPGQVRPGTAGGAPPPPEVRVVADRLLVKFREGTPQDLRQALLAAAGVTPEGRIAGTGTRIAGVPPRRRAAALVSLASSPAVEYAESDVVLDLAATLPNDPRWSDQWGPRKVSAPSAWDTARGSSSVVIAVLDTGVDFGHSDLEGASVPGHDFVNGDSDPADDQGHGTAAAGVVAARTNNAVGMAGTCWTCSLMSVKVLDENGSGSTSTVARGIVWAADNGARVINLSLGGTGSTQTLADAVSYAAGKGLVLVAAAGNSGNSTPFYPAAYPEVIAVAATDSSDARYSWSNYGSWVQVAAPGCNVASLRGGGYGTFCGTSSATPVVAGIAGLALAAKPDAVRTQLEQAIADAAAPVGAFVQHGRVDAGGTLTALGATQAVETPTTASARFKGTITRRHPRRVYRRTVARGPLVASLAFSGTRRLRLVIVNPRGKAVRRVSGRSPLRAEARVRAGTFRFVVRGKDKKRAPFTLRVTYQAP